MKNIIVITVPPHNIERHQKCIEENLKIKYNYRAIAIAD